MDTLPTNVQPVENLPATPRRSGSGLLGEMVVMAIVCGVQVGIFILIRDFGWQLAVSALSLPVIYWLFGIDNKGISALVWFIPLMVGFSAFYRFGLLAGILIGAVSLPAVLVMMTVYIQLRMALSIRKATGGVSAPQPATPSEDELMASLKTHLEAAKQEAADGDRLRKIAVLSNALVQVGCPKDDVDQLIANADYTTLGEVAERVAASTHVSTWSSEEQRAFRTLAELLLKNPGDPAVGSEPSPRDLPTSQY